MAFDPRSLALYPDQTGVYLMKDASNRVLYVGKAKNLRARLRQYFAESDEREMVPYLTSQVETIDTIIALSEKDALILENQLIKQHQPLYQCFGCETNLRSASQALSLAPMFRCGAPEPREALSSLRYQALHRPVRK